MPEIMIIDDDRHIRNMLREILEGEGYSVSAAASGYEALAAISDNKPDLILLDLMLPGLSGEELLPKISGIPVIALSAKTAVTDKVGMLLSGAADYITKPFDIRELLARITVQLRKNKAVTDVIRYHELALDTATLTASANGSEVRLTRTECAILKLLMLEPEKPVGRSAILDRISLDTPDCTERSLKQHISNIRRKLRSISGKEYIEAIYGIGFRMKY